MGRAGLRDIIFRERSYWFSMSQVMFLLLFFWNRFSHKKTNHALNLCYCNCLRIPHPNYTMISPVIKTVEEMKMKNHTKTKIGVGSVIKAKVGELDNITREVRSRRMRQDRWWDVSIVCWGRRSF